MYVAYTAFSLIRENLGYMERYHVTVNIKHCQQEQIYTIIKTIFPKPVFIVNSIINYSITSHIKYSKKADIRTCVRFKSLKYQTHINY